MSKKDVSYWLVMFPGPVRVHIDEKDWAFLSGVKENYEFTLADGDTYCINNASKKMFIIDHEKIAVIVCNANKIQK